MTIPNSHLPWMTDDVAMYRDGVRAFIKGEVTPHLEAWRKQGRSDPEVWRRLGALGLLLPELPEEHGGAGGNVAHQMVLQDELARAESPGNTSVHSIAAHYVLDHGTDEQRRRLLPKMATGELLGAIAMTEPGAGSDLQAIRTRAIRDGSHYVVNGSKTFITAGSTANLVVLAVKTDPSQGAKGISLLIVETENLAGFRVGRLLEKVGQKASDTAELFFDDVRVPVENLIGHQEGRGFAQLMDQLPFERLQIAVGAVALAERALELTIAYTKERQAFGKRVFDFQNTRFTLAECATRVHIMRTFLNDCIQRLVDGRLDIQAAFMAKWWCTDEQCHILDECVQLFGGYGYMLEYPIARMWADARVARIYGGTNEVMKELIGRSL